MTVLHISTITTQILIFVQDFQVCVRKSVGFRSLACEALNKIRSSMICQVAEFFYPKNEMEDPL